MKEHSKVRATFSGKPEKEGRNRAVVKAYYQRDKTMQDIAKDFGVSRERIRQIIKRWGDEYDE